MKGSIASGAHTEATETKRENEAQPTSIEDALIREIPPDMTKWIHMVNDCPRCMICQKWATEWHLTSSEHVKRIEEDAIGTLMGGELTVIKTRVLRVSRFALARLRFDCVAF